MSKGKKKSNKKGAIIGIIIFVILLLVAGFAYGWIALMPGYLSPEKAVEKYFEAVTNEDTALYKKTCYTVKWRDSVALDDKIKEAFSLQSGATYSNVNIVSKETLESDYSEKMASSLNTRYGFDQKISKIVMVNFTVDTVFDGQSLNSGTITRYCYKCGGKWYFLADPDVLVDIKIEG